MMTCIDVIESELIASRELDSGFRRNDDTERHPLKRAYGKTGREIGVDSKRLEEEAAPPRETVDSGFRRNDESRNTTTGTAAEQTPQGTSSIPCRCAVHHLRGTYE